jgi:hypothetical protein
MVDPNSRGGSSATREEKLLIAEFTNSTVSRCTW